ncbi:ArsA family ATPase [Sorangium sp. So ce1000]|uniref:ArsA family ATPase n=1 Tax=Sorangium sp. So ce1000 TaxID=3133325 RepID=UPI003F5E9602
MTSVYQAPGAGGLGQDLPELERRRFLFVTGKGGVGKTTISGALALAFAARGKRVLVAMCHTKERLSAILGSKPIGPEVAQVGERVWAVNIAPDRALREYGEMVLKMRAAADLVFDNKYTRTFFRAVPGLFEWAMLGKAWFHTTELLPDGSNRFDVVLLDAPATGHGMDMLRVPKVILDVAPPGILRRDAEAAWAMFRDPARSGVVVVTLPEEMPATETVELVAEVRGDLGLPVHRVIINGVLPALFSPEEQRALLVDPARLDIEAPARSADTVESAIVAGARRAIRESVQRESLARLRRDLDLPTVMLPFLFDEASTVAGTRMLAERL